MTTADPKYYRDRYARLKQAGLCVRCGKQPIHGSTTRCVPCRDRMNETQNLRKAKRQAPAEPA